MLRTVASILNIRLPGRESKINFPLKEGLQDKTKSFLFTTVDS